MLARLEKGKSGRDPDEFVWGLIYDLACLYKWATNKRPTITYNPYGLPGVDYGPDDEVGIYESPFLDFVSAVLQCLRLTGRRETSRLASTSSVF
jgi:hypothetical protein